MKDYLTQYDKLCDMIFISVPNEKGIALLIKYLLKKLFFRDSSTKYSLLELYYATLGKLNKIQREECGHKGFDYQNLVNDLREIGYKVKVEGVPFYGLPNWLNPTVGIVGMKDS